MKPQSRFGSAFYVAEQPTTSLSEMKHYGIEPKTGIRFSINYDELKLLDLTDPNIAAAFGYKGGPISSDTQKIGLQAAAKGFNAIKYFSERAVDGTNIAVIGNFNKILKPIMITPVNP